MPFGVIDDSQLKQFREPRPSRQTTFHQRGGRDALQCVGLPCGRRWCGAAAPNDSATWHLPPPSPALYGRGHACPLGSEPLGVKSWRQHHIGATGLRSGHPHRGRSAIGANLRMAVANCVALLILLPEGARIGSRSVEETPCRASGTSGREARTVKPEERRQSRRPQPRIVFAKRYSVPDGTAEKGGGVLQSAIARASSPACPPGRYALSVEDPVVPGLITGLHHRLGFHAPSGSRFLL
jgi:hypothetical protein